jgi:chlorite dismutase
MSNEARPMNPNQARHAEIPEPSLTPIQGWHCGHYFYRWNRETLQRLSSNSSGLQQGIQQFVEAMSPREGVRPERFQSFIVSGHKADFGLVMMDPDPLKIDRVHQKLLSGLLGAAIEPTYSFVSEQYAQKLLRSGEDRTSPSFEAKVNSYEKRLPTMLAHRLSPEFPEWPSMCFYPMNKVRNVGANWFLLPFSERTEMMAEHAQSGMAFAGRVTQLVTASVGLDDWEWGVTLWAKNPQYLKDIVYTMRFDQASARFGQFGPFYTGYLATAGKILEHCCIE